MTLVTPTLQTQQTISPEVARRTPTIVGSCVICHDTEKLRKKWDCISCHACVMFHYTIVYKRKRRSRECSFGRRNGCRIDYTLDKAACRYCRLNRCFEMGWPRTRQAMIHYEYKRIFGWIPSPRNVSPPRDLRDKTNLSAIRRRLHRIRRRQRLSDAEDDDEDDDWAVPKCSICSRRHGQGRILLQVRGLAICNKCQVFISKTRSRLMRRRVPTLLYNCRSPGYKACSHCRFMKAIEFGWFREHFNPKLDQRLRPDQLSACSECGFLFEKTNKTTRNSDGNNSSDDDDDGEEDQCQFCKELMQMTPDSSPNSSHAANTSRSDANTTGATTNLDDSGLFSRSSNQSVSYVEIDSSDSNSDDDDDASTTIYDSDFYEYD